MIKKYFLLFAIIAVFCCGCTTKEQDQKIKLFWLQQFANASTKVLAVNMNKLASLQAKGAFGKKPSLPVKTASVQPTVQKTAPVRQPVQESPQLIEVTLDTDQVVGVAPQADLTRMKRAISAVQLANQKTLTDIGTTFGESVKNKALMITAATERKLKQEASVAATFTEYLAKQRDLLTAQNKQLNQLMTQNAKNIRNINTRAKSL